MPFPLFNTAYELKITPKVVFFKMLFLFGKLKHEHYNF